MPKIAMLGTANWETWHRRFAYVGKKGLDKLQHEDLVTGMCIAEGPALTGTCEDCIFGKHLRNLFQGPMSQEDAVLNQVYTDLADPFRV